MLSVASVSVLVAGSVPTKQMAVKIKVIRPFMLYGKAQPVNTVLEVSNSFAHEMVSMKKAELVKDLPPAPEPEQKAAKRPEGK